ncbi:hypothetical protein Cs308_0117 [Candidatus Chlamydia sanziniae]|uniref:Uncharacterized protein n=1 Tax=Candidatus Chlamydia sanziniae TaxID=1806891 RepID=A0A1A9HTG8_9CHLA|nr:hypothetical protein Cs308_0117 [Candidatus Chlamydia sanziniae]
MYFLRKKNFFFREVSPDTKVTSRLGRDKAFANKATTASFALPFSGGSVTRIFKVFPSKLRILFSLALGKTFTSKHQYPTCIGYS